MRVRGDGSVKSDNCSYNQRATEINYTAAIMTLGGRDFLGQVFKPDPLF